MPSSSPCPFGEARAVRNSSAKLSFAPRCATLLAVSARPFSSRVRVASNHVAKAAPSLGLGRSPRHTSLGEPTARRLRVLSACRQRSFKVAADPSRSLKNATASPCPVGVSRSNGSCTRLASRRGMLVESPINSCCNTLRAYRTVIAASKSVNGRRYWYTPNEPTMSWAWLACSCRVCPSRSLR